MSMWEPFTAQARHAVTRAQEVAQMFGNNFIDTEHIVFALGDTDDDLGRVLTNAVDRDQLRAELGGAGSAVQQEMVFTPAAKRSIELAFEHARRLNHNYIAAAHLALGIVDSKCPPLRTGVDLAVVQAELSALAARERSAAPGTLRGRWAMTAGEKEQLPPGIQTLQSALGYLPDLGDPGTQLRITLASPDGAERSWTWTRGDPAG